MNVHKLYEPFFRRFRPRRMQYFVELFHVDDHTRVLDVGGSPGNWSLLEERPWVTIMNIEEESPRIEGRFTFEYGDGRSLRYDDRSFDITFSNSVIEHVGTLSNQFAFAAEICRVGKGYFVQTPNRWFFMEPHVVAPFVHLLPKRVQRRLLRWTPWGLMAKPSQKFIDDFLASTRLLTYREMCRMFPDGVIHKERWLGMTKSLIAIRPPE